MSHFQPYTWLRCIIDDIFIIWAKGLDIKPKNFHRLCLKQHSPHHYVPVKSKLKHPPGIPRAFDVFSCPEGRKFDELSLPQDGTFDHYSSGVGNLIASPDRTDSTWRYKSWRRQALMHSKGKIHDSWRTG